MTLFSINFIILPGLFVLSRLTMGEAAAIHPLNNVTAGSDQFALDLYMQIKSHTNDSMITSPIGVQIILAMTALGAKGNTLNELIKTAVLPPDLDSRLAGYNLLVERLKGPELKMADRIFVDDKVDLLPSFSASMVKDFSSAIQKLPLKAKPVDAVKTINKWAANETNGKITYLLTKDDVESASVILANAIYFKANWKNKFNWQNTHDDKFFTSNSTQVKVKMMSMTESLRYGHSPELKSKILELPYQNDRFRMVIILPDDIEGLPEAEKQLHAMGIAKARQNLNVTKVEIKIPKFKIESDLNLVDDLKKLGLQTLFGADCDLTGMTKTRVKVDNVKQKAYIGVYEVGTEAAAVTAGTIFATGQVEPPAAAAAQFIANHPFLYMIMSDDNTNYSLPYPLFVGNVRSFKN